MGRRIVIAVSLGVVALAESGWASPRSQRDPAVLRVVVLDQPGVRMTAAVLHGAEADAASIFAAAGVRLVWRESEADGDDFDVTVRIVSGTRLAGLSSDRAESTLGFAITDKDAAGLRGRVVYVRLDQIEQYADEHPVSATHLFGLVIAHELGHLLLAPGHSRTGLMTAVWHPELLTAMYFTNPQVETIHARMALLDADRGGHRPECFRPSACGAPVR